MLCAALLSSAAVVIVVIKRGLLDLDVVVTKVVGWAGLALAVSGVLYLMHIWWVDRFQVTIGRLMFAVAVIAFLLAYVLSMFPSK